MHLPEDKATRQKIMAGVLAGMLAATYALWTFVYEPIRQQRAETVENIEKLEAELKTTRALIRRLPEMRRDLEETTQLLRERSEYNMLHPRLGNFLLESREIVLEYGLEAGARNILINETGLVILPRRTKKGREETIQGYAVRVSAECSLDELLIWFERLEQSNPLLAIGQFMVTAQTARPLRHQVRFDVQWPVWISPNMRETVRTTAAEILGEAVP